ncbi:spermidine synthase [Hymenobacter psychrophilus]|uniref:Methyltransferase domain-containing protein n=1 Tax=Hymenobacter psychrophilus TaxID=651662 RepID=A0A1H3ENA3_9BACT|nr:fused MFS/spermidine synthase [Hymenobacter psychrophilus]SDX80100.1 Methyltransferase domain-containing protein [Hymenobacter psychrophilus]
MSLDEAQNGRFSFRRLLSYLVPLTRRVPSAYSGSLEITTWRGYKVLNTALANYSYGSLQRVLRYGLRFVPVADAAAPVLILGLGGGSVLPLLRREQGRTGAITAVELDPAVLQVAAEEFGVKPGPGLALVCADAFAWLPTAPPDFFELVVVDLFLDLTLPSELGEVEFWQQLRRVLRPGGRALCNLLVTVELRPDTQPLPEFLEELGFAVKDMEVEQLNRLLILQRRA